MTKRTVTFTVGNGTVMPSVPQYGGVKGEHNATLARFVLENLYGAGDTARLSFTTGDGTVLSSDILDSIEADGETATLSYLLPQLLTVAAGQLSVRVVLSRMENGKETVTFRSPEMVLYFEDASVENGTPFWTGVSEMLVRTATAKDTAVAAAEKAIGACNAASEYAVFAQNAVNTPGRRGEDGKSAYAYAVEGGYQGSEQEFSDDLAKVRLETMRYIGAVSSEMWLTDIHANVGDVVLVTVQQRFYICIGEGIWLALGSGDSVAPHIGENGNWFIGETDTGVKAQGEKGDPYTLTESDKAAIVNAVLTAIGGNPVFGYVDEENNIIVSGNLADGTYTLKYENEDGTYTEVGTLELGAMPEPEVVVNLLDTAYDTDLQTVYNGVGYKSGARISNGAGGETSGSADTVLTGLIPLGSDGDVLHVRGVTSVIPVDGNSSGIRSCWDASGNYIASSVADMPKSCIGTDENGDISITMTHSAWTLPEGTAYIRLQFYKVTGDGFIITRNQLITV